MGLDRVGFLGWFLIHYKKLIFEPTVSYPDHTNNSEPPKEKRYGHTPVTLYPPLKWLFISFQDDFAGDPKN